MEKAAQPLLIVTADDYGYARGHDAGILAAARAGAVDAVGVMVGRDPDPAPLDATGVEVGLHLELDPDLPRDGRVGPRRREAALAALGRQLGEFERLFGRPPAYLDGHRHCHAAPGVAAAIARACAERDLPLRSVSPGHRRILRRLGIATPDRLVGRLTEAERALPREIEAWLETGTGPPGVTEWIVHPGHPDPASGSRYDAGRAEDLELLLRLERGGALRASRTTHGAALARPSR